MSIESLRRETLLSSELDLALPENSMVFIETTTASGCELSALRVMGGGMISPITAVCRMNPRPTEQPTRVTFVNSKTEEVRVLTLPENNGVVTIQLKPLIAETSEAIRLERVSNSELMNVLKKS